MIAYKFLGHDRVALYTGYEWPVEEWVEAEGELDVCTNGIHACTEGELPMWIDDELWVIEVDEVIETDDVLVARRGRLLRRVEEWDGAVAREFAESCVWRLRDQVVSLFRLENRDARPLTQGRDLEGVERGALALLESVAPHAELLGLLADCVELLRGNRPEAYYSPLSDVPPTHGAIAANLGFVVAHAFGRAALLASGSDASYGRGYATERARQSDWLCERLRLET